jgi:hypothetical protein
MRLARSVSRKLPLSCATAECLGRHTVGKRRPRKLVVRS